MIPIIMHIDMNSYFASCEQQDNLAWRYKPLGVCEHLGGIIIAASVEAKKWGIKTGTPVWEAKRLYPKIILTKTTPDRYRYYTARFLKVFADYSDKIEKYSIDEAFLDLTRSCMLKGVDPFVEAERIAKEIKQRMLFEVGDYIRCSVGIGTNKLVAKIASDMQKPDGLVVVRPENKHLLYKQLKLTDIPGIGFRMEKRLNELGIKTLSDLRDYSRNKLVEQFGVQGFHLYNMGQLEGSWKEGFNEEPMKSIGHMYTLAKEHRTPGSFEPLLYKLSEMVAVRLRVNQMIGSNVYAHAHLPIIQQPDFSVDKPKQKSYVCLAKSKKLSYNIQDGRDIFLESLLILKELGLKPKTDIVNLIGITVSGLNIRSGQRSLFEFENKKQPVMKALDKVNEKYGDFTLTRVPAFQAREFIRDSVGFGRMKEFTSSPVKRTFYGH